MRIVRFLLAIGAAGLATTILAGHLGSLHPALDAFSHLRIQMLGLAMILCAVLTLARMWRGAVILGAVAVGSAALTLPWLLPREVVDGRAFVLMQQNLLYRNGNVAALLDRVAEVEPDVIALQEIGGRARGIADALRAEYPHVHQCRGVSAVGDVAVLSRVPFAPDLRARCTPGLAIAAVRLDDVAVAVGSLHLHWPWPFGQDRHLESLARHVPAIAAPGLLAGDFNAVPWSASAERLARMMDGRVVRGIGPSRREPDLPDWLQPLWDIPIDNVVVTGFIEVLGTESIPLDGSDHDTVVTRFRFRVPPAPEEETFASADGANLVVHQPVGAHLIGFLNQIGEADRECEDHRKRSDGANSDHAYSLPTGLMRPNYRFPSERCLMERFIERSGLLEGQE